MIKLAKCHVRKPLRVYDPKNANTNLYKVDAKARANLKSSKFMIEIHFDATSGPHMHITDAHGNVYDTNLNNLTAKFKQNNPTLTPKQIEKRIERLPEAHISVKEFVRLQLRLDNE